MSTPTNPYDPPQASELPPHGGLPHSPTYARYGVIGFTAAMSFLLYLDRFALSAASQTLCEDLKIDDEAFGRGTSAFFWAYALCQVPAGWIADRCGGRITLAICVLGWSLSMMGMGMVNDLMGLIVMRVLLGIFQAPAYPAAGGYLKEWMPVSARGFANGSTAMSGRSGDVVTKALTPILMALFVTSFGAAQGWRQVFFIYGSLGIVWSIAFWFWFRNRPEEHSGCNDAERTLIDEGRTESKEPPPPALPILALLRSPNMWLISGVNLFSNIGWVFLATWLPKYLEGYHHLSKQEAGFLSSITAVAGMTGCLLGGFVSDYLVRMLGTIYGRKAVPMFTPIVAIVLYVLVTQTSDPYVQVGLFTGIWFFLDFELSSRWGVSQDVGGKHTATVMGFGNMCGNLGAAFFSGYIGQFAKEGDWNTVFTIACVALGCLWLCWIFIDGRVPVVPEDPPMKQVEK